MTPEDSKHLDEFFELIEELRSIRFMRDLLSQDSITVTHRGDWDKASIMDFDEDDCRSFLLSFRLLLQDNDKISIRCISKIIENNDFSDDCKRLVDNERFSLQLSLSSQCPIAVPDGDSVTNQEVVYTFLYGFYAHRGMNKTRRERYLLWKKDSRQFYPLKSQFLCLMQIIMSHAQELDRLIKAEQVHRGNG